MHQQRIHVMWEVELAGPYKFSLISTCVHLELVGLRSISELLSCVLLWDKAECLEQGWLLPSLFHFDNQTWVSSTYPLSKVRFRDGLLTLSKGKAAKDGVVWELIWDLDILVHSSPPGCSLSYPTSFMYTIFSGLSRVGLALFQTGQSDLGWLLKCVRVWKLSRTYPGEKTPSLSFLTQECCFATYKPTLHLLVISSIPVGMRVLYEVLMKRSVPPAQGLWRHLSKEN